MEFNDELKDNIFLLVGAILHSSNISFEAVSSDEFKVEMDNLHLKPVLLLSGIEADAFSNAMCTTTICAGGRAVPSH